MIALAALLLWTQASTVGGSSETAHTAEQVRPPIPAGPRVAMIETALGILERVARNCAEVTVGVARKAFADGGLASGR